MGGPLSNPTQQRKQPSRSSMALMSPPCPRTLRCPRLPIREIAQNPRFFLCVEITHVRIFVHTHPLCVSFVCEYAIVRFSPEECVRLYVECVRLYVECVRLYVECVRLVFVRNVCVFMWNVCVFKRNVCVFGMSTSCLYVECVRLYVECVRLRNVYVLSL